MKQSFLIQGPLPGLNEYTRANRSHAQAGASMKRQAEAIITAYVRAAQLEPYAGKVSVRFLWMEPDARRDPDNVAFAKKFVLDVLVREGVLRGDGQKHVGPLHDDFDVRPDTPGVIVELEEASS